MNPDSGTDNLQAWLGRQMDIESELNCADLDKLAATLDLDQPPFKSAMPIPSLWHWLFFQRPALHSLLDADGHPRRGDFLPPVTLPKRMWAGSRLKFQAPLLAGEPARAHSEITAITRKQGSSGPLVFVTASHQISQRDQLCLTEQQDIVYRENGAAAASARSSETTQGSRQETRQKASQQTADYSRTLSADPALLFRYSALTFNAHRIHYDRDYARDKEQYPGLVVHGPLLATMLMELWRQQFPDHTANSFQFRALAPVFDLTPFHLCGRQPDNKGCCQLWVEDEAGKVCLQAEVMGK